MADYTELAARLAAALAPEPAPVAITFADTATAGHARPDKPIAAGCQFWQLGAKAALATDATDHAHCAIGIHTHNIAGAPAAQATELSATLAAMQGLDYVRPEEIAGIPVHKTSSAFVNYTPLADCVDEPAVVLIMANAVQGLVLAEAIARVDGGPPAALGRPACALVPAVANAGQAASSLGCCGARAYIDQLTDDRTLWALPGANLAGYIDAIETLARANATLTQYHVQRRADIAAGEQPTVNESLARL